MAALGAAQADRSRAVRRVLLGILVANLAVILIKVVVGLSTGSLAVFGDTIHSTVDAVNNVLGVAVVRLASKAPDAEHPYGHGKFETLGALLVVVFLSVAILEVVRGAIGRLATGFEPLSLSPGDAGLLVVTLAINLWVVWYETRAGRRLRSDILVADAAHTRADVFITLAVMAGLGLSQVGIAWADPVLAILVSLVVLKIGYDILRRSVPSLVDEAAVAQDTIRDEAMTISGVRSAYDIRSRTAAAQSFAELTIAVDGTENVAAAHRIADQVEARLQTELGLDQVVVHVEPC